MSDPILIDLPERIEGHRIYLRPFRPGDGRALFEAVAESMPDLGEWFPWASGHRSPDDSEGTVRRLAAAWMLREDLTVGIWRTNDGAFLGGSGLHQIDWRLGQFMIGYWIRQSARRQGYATEAATLLRDFAFNSLKATRVHIRCGEPNVGSASVATKAGFIQEGVLRDEACRYGDELCNMLVFGMTRARWQALDGR